MPGFCLTADQYGEPVRSKVQGFTLLNSLPTHYIQAQVKSLMQGIPFTVHRAVGTHKVVTSFYPCCLEEGNTRIDNSESVKFSV